MGWEVMKQRVGLKRHPGSQGCALRQVCLFHVTATCWQSPGRFALKTPFQTLPSGDISTGGGGVGEGWVSEGSCRQGATRSRERGLPSMASYVAFRTVFPAV